MDFTDETAVCLPAPPSFAPLDHAVVAMPAIPTDSLSAPITKLGPKKGEFDVDFNDDERHYIRSQESPELNKFFSDVRTVCLGKVSKDPELYYPQDVDKLQRQEWMIRRFMTHHKGDQLHTEDVTRTSETIIKMMQWKRKMNLRGENGACLRVILNLSAMQN